MDMKVKMLHLAAGSLNGRVWKPLFMDQLSRIGELRIEEDTRAWPDEQVAELCRQYDVVLTDWGSRRLPECLALEPGCLRYVCNISGTIRPFVPRVFIERGLSVTNWGPLPAFKVAEGTLALLLALLKDLPRLQKEIGDGGWAALYPDFRGSVRNLRLGLYGLGVIGKAFIDLVRPLQPRLKAYDRFADVWPEGVERAGSLEDLFADIEVVIVAVALTPETRKSVRAEHFAKLPEGGIVINTARGAILDQEALFTELETGRLRAGLDVLDTDGKDWLPEDHPARSWTNLLLTGHKVSSCPWNDELYEADSLSDAQETALANLKRFIKRQPLHHLFDVDRYDRST